MEDIYSFEVSDYEFEKMMAGVKVAHLFVNLPKYKTFAIGNEITFVMKTENEQKEIETIIENILYFSDITEAIESVGKEKCGFRPSQTFDKASDLFLSNESYEQIEKYGVGVILFKIQK